jgi:hypothetical protein
MELTTYYDKGKINGTNLKWIAIITMLIDHTAAILVNSLSDQAYLGMRLIGRMAFPIFCFLLVQGFIHTKNVMKYAFRLMIFAIVSEFIFDFAFYGEIYFGHQNVFFTLLIGLLTIYAMKIWDGQTLMQITAVIMGCLVAYLLNVDYGYLGVMQIVFLYNLRYFRGWRIASILLMNGLIYNIFPIGLLGGALDEFIRTGSLGDVFVLDSFSNLLRSLMQFAFACSSLIFIENYNGKRGKGWQYVFYVFYPAHLLILLLIQRWLNL